MVSGNPHLSLGASALIETPIGHTTSADRLVDLFRPLARLLSEGGDERLAVQPGSELNAYGYHLRPRPGAISLSSSTATSISDRAYRRARRAQEALIEQASVKGLFEAFDTRMSILAVSPEQFEGQRLHID